MISRRLEGCSRRDRRPSICCSERGRNSGASAHGGVCRGSGIITSSCMHAARPACGGSTAASAGASSCTSTVACQLSQATSELIDFLSYLGMLSHDGHQLLLLLLLYLAKLHSLHASLQGKRVGWEWREEEEGREESIA